MLPHAIAATSLNSSVFIPAIELSDTCVCGMFIPDNLYANVIAMSKKLINSQADLEYRYC